MNDISYESPSSPIIVSHPINDTIILDPTLVEALTPKGNLQHKSSINNIFSSVVITVFVLISTTNIT